MAVHTKPDLFTGQQFQLAHKGLISAFLFFTFSEKLIVQQDIIYQPINTATNSLKPYSL